MVDTRPLQPFGCEITLDLRERTGDDEAELRALFDRHHLLVFRHQALTMDEQHDVLALFGPVLPGRDGHSFITNEATPENVLGDGPLAFHSDLSFVPRPYSAISLHAVEVEDGRSSTMFVDTTRTAAALPDDLRARASAARTLQGISYDLGGRDRARLGATRGSCEHPAIRPHPRTGEDVLMVSYNQTARIVNLPEAEGEALLAELFARLYAPGEIYEHVWRRGDLVIWDNLALQHARGPISDCGTRRLQRVVVGEAGLFEQLPEGFVVETEVGRGQPYS